MREGVLQACYSMAALTNVLLGLVRESFLPNKTSAEKMGN